MKPENQLQIKRNVLTFSIIVLLLSVAIGSSAWTFLGDGMRRTRNEALFATAVHDSLKSLVDSLSESNRSSQNLSEIIATMERTDSMVSSLESNYANAKGFADLRNAGLLDVRIDRPTEMEKRLLSAYHGIVSDLGSYGDFIFNSRADPGSMLKQLDDCNRKIMVLEEQAKKAASSGTGTQKTPTNTNTQTTEVAPCSIACSECQRIERTINDINVLSELQLKNVKANNKGKDNRLSHEVNYPTNVESGNKKPWVEKQYIDLVLAVNKKFNREVR